MAFFEPIIDLEHYQLFGKKTIAMQVERGVPQNYLLEFKLLYPDTESGSFAI